MTMSSASMSGTGRGDGGGVALYYSEYGQEEAFGLVKTFCSYFGNRVLNCSSLESDLNPPHGRPASDSRRSC